MQNDTIVESYETYGNSKGPVQLLFSMICFHFHFNIKYKRSQRWITYGIAPHTQVILKHYTRGLIEWLCLNSKTIHAYEHDEWNMILLRCFENMSFQCPALVLD